MITQDYSPWKPAEEPPTDTRPVLLAVERNTGKPITLNRGGMSVQVSGMSGPVFPLMLFRWPEYKVPQCQLNTK